MQSTIRYLANPEGKRYPILSDDISANKLAQLPAIKGKIGKTGILELLRGSKQSVKGWQLIEDRKPDRANKVGVEYCGTGKMRQRAPMKIYIRPSSERGISDRVKGDFRKFLVACYSQASKSESGMVEYGTIGAELGGWTRNMVSVYANRARKLGYITTERHSNPVR